MSPLNKTAVSIEDATPIDQSESKTNFAEILKDNITKFRNSELKDLSAKVRIEVENVLAQIETKVTNLEALVNAIDDGKSKKEIGKIRAEAREVLNGLIALVYNSPISTQIGETSAVNAPMPIALITTKNLAMPVDDNILATPKLLADSDKHLLSPVALTSLNLEDLETGNYSYAFQNFLLAIFTITNALGNDTFKDLLYGKLKQINNKKRLFKNGQNMRKTLAEIMPDKATLNIALKVIEFFYKARKNVQERKNANGAINLITTPENDGLVVSKSPYGSWKKPCPDAEVSYALTDSRTNKNSLKSPEPTIVVPLSNNQSEEPLENDVISEKVQNYLSQFNKLTRIYKLKAVDEPGRAIKYRIPESSKRESTIVVLLHFRGELEEYFQLNLEPPTEKQLIAYNEDEDEYYNVYFDELKIA